MSGPGGFTNPNQYVIDTFRANQGVVHGTARFILLTTTGAKSGQSRTTPLAYSTDGAKLVIVASNSGSPTNPDWYHNLIANPVVTVELGAEKFQARATVVADEAERQRLYARHAELMPSYAEYTTKTERKIPVILLERLEQGASGQASTEASA